jgi:hypothetical protein
MKINKPTNFSRILYGCKRAGMLLAACALLFISCNKENNEPTPNPEPVTWTLRYAVCVTDNPENVPLPTLAGKTISKIVLIDDEDTEWLNATPATNTGGVPSVDVILSEWRPSGLVIDGIATEIHPRTKDSLVVETTDGTNLLLVVRQAHTPDPHLYQTASTNGLHTTASTVTSAQFISDWETTMSINFTDGRGDPCTTNTPWANIYSGILPPGDLRTDVKRTDGWNMAFCLFPDENVTKFPYFGLFNKYTGMLRVFYYQPDVTSAGGEFSFLVTPNNKSTPKFPYYHSWQYGIPANHTNMHLIQNPYDITVSGDASQTFQNLIVPYSAAKMCILSVGWFAFDMDFSFYSGSNATQFAANDGLQFTGLTQQNTSVTMYGDITGTIYTPEIAPQKIGTSGILASIGSGIGAVTNCISSVLSGNVFGGISSLITGGLDCASKATTANKPGSGAVTQTVNEKISLSGYLNTATSNNVLSAGFVFDAMFTNAVQGVWGLQRDPVLNVSTIPIVRDVESIAAPSHPANAPENVSVEVYNYNSKSRFMMRKRVDVGAYGRYRYDFDNLYLTLIETYSSYNVDFAYNEDYFAYMDAFPRAVMWIDPSSILINLNTALFPNIKNVNVTWNWGSYNASQALGYTNTVRSTMGLPKVGGEGVNEPWWNNYHLDMSKYNSTVSVWGTIHTVDQMAVPWYKHNEWELLSPDIKALFEPNCYFNIVEPNTHEFDVWGADVTDGTNNHFLYTPQVSLPNDGSGYCFDPTIPDIVVWVQLSFEYTDANGVEQVGIFTKRFLPQINITNDMNNIEGYLDKYANGTAIQTINGIPVTQKGSAPALFIPNLIRQSSTKLAGNQ